MNLYEKMYNVMNESEAIEKNMTVGTGSNSYKAVSESEILNMVKPLFKKYRLIIFPIDGDMKDNALVYEKTDYNGKTANNIRAITELRAKFRIQDVDSDQYQDIVGFGNGADTQDKGAGKAFTYSFKNALSKTFMLFSGEDTDNEHSDDIDRKNSYVKPQPTAADKKAKDEAQQNFNETFASEPPDYDKIIMELCFEKNVESNTILKHYKVNEIKDLTRDQKIQAIAKLRKTEAK